MYDTNKLLSIPVENQVRELDPKLLLAYIAARRGFSSVIGSRQQLDFRIASFPRGIYLSKSMTARGGKMFQLMRKIGHEIAARCERVQVTNEGNVIPWLMATRALMHNGCTTGVEAYVMRVPAISYRATVNDYYDYGFYQLPNRLSHQCLNFEQLRATMMRILSGELGAADSNESKELIDHHLAATNGPLACERVSRIKKALDDSSTSQVDQISSEIFQISPQAG